jgi:multidrug transporter EmrE-like cation transporter
VRGAKTSSKITHSSPTKKSPWYYFAMSLVNTYVSLASKIPVTILIILAAASVIIGDYSAKAWSVSQNNMYLLLAFLGYFFSGFFYIPTLLREGLIITSVLWVLLSTIGFIVSGYVIFKESLSLAQTIAVTLGIVSILILSVVD